MTGYVYRGTRRDAGIDLEAANKAIMADRDAARSLDGNPGWEWPAQRAARLAGQIQCGTEEGYRRHLRWHEPTCKPCRAAHATAKRPKR